MLTVKYGVNTLEVPEDLTAEQVRESLVSIYPEIANATAEITDGVLEFKVTAGTKGADLEVIYGQNTLSVPADMTDEEIRASLVGIYPEIANAQATREGNTLRFEVRAGTKGR